MNLKRKPIGIINANLYGTTLEYGNIDTYKGKNLVCYFIVEQIHDAEYMEKQMRQFIVSECKRICFYGKYSNEWYKCAMGEYFQIYPDLDKKQMKIALSKYNFNNFIAEIYGEISTRVFVPTDYYIVYDDITSYINVLESLKNKESKMKERLA